ncbi:DUF1439 domain-containing protein [Burkholderiaceae bacterium UC74_6]
MHTTTPNRFRWLLLLCVAAGVAAALWSCTSLGVLAKGYLEIEAAELQSRISPRFPVKHCKTVLLCAELSNPVVTLSEGDNRVGLSVDIKINLGPRERSGHLGMSGRPRYAPGQGQLFLDDLQVDQVDVGGVSGDHAEWLRYGATLAAQKALQDRPVYTLDERTAKGALAKRAISDVRVTGGKLRVVFAGSTEQP